MSRTSNLFPAFVTCSSGLEPALFQEMKTLGIERVQMGRGGVSIWGSRFDFEKVTLSTRLGHRVLWQLASAFTPDAEALYQAAKTQVNWAGFLAPPKGEPKTFAVYASTKDTPLLKDSRFVALRVKDAMTDALVEKGLARPQVDIEDPDIVVRLSIAKGRMVLSLDAVGKQSLHARGYRRSKGEAPLRETLAFGLLELSGWKPGLPLIDPLCGSGTIVIEAALAEQGIFPGQLKALRPHYGFERWPGYKEKRLSNLLQAKKAKPSELIRGADLDEEVLALAKENQERAGVSFPLSQGDARDRAHLVALKGGLPKGLLLANLPWGVRMGQTKAVEKLAIELVSAWKGVFSGWNIGLLLPEETKEDEIFIKQMKLFPLKSGRISVKLLTGRL